MSQTSAPDPTGTAAVATMRQGANWREWLSVSAIWIVLIVLIGIAYAVSPVFLSPRNIGVLLKQAAPLGILAVGQTLVILTGGIDLSVASLMAAVSVFSAGLIDGQDELVVPVVFVCMLFSIIVGLANGLLVTKLKIPPFITTLGMILIVQGIRFVYSKGTPKTYIPDSLRFFGRDSLGPIPMALIVWVVIVVIVALILSRTTFGRCLYATGGNPRTAYLSGVDIDRIKIAAYTTCSFLAGIAGLILVGYVGTADNFLGLGYELNAIAAVVIGGTAFEGGKGSQIGTIAGVLILTLLFNLVLMLQFDEEARRIVKGLIILTSVALYARLRTRSE
jgi:ribose/xylose/arabinose/galactoside ABC-type transport system permease subunit